MSAKITVAPFTFSAETGVQPTRWPHPLELFNHGENRAWILAVLALRAQPSCQQRASGVPAPADAARDALAEVIPLPTLRQRRDAA